MYDCTEKIRKLKKNPWYTLKSKNIMITYLIILLPFSGLQNSLFTPCLKCWTSLVDGRINQGLRNYHVFKESAIWNIPTWWYWALSCHSMTPEMDSIGLTSGELGGEGINWNSALRFESFQHNMSLVRYSISLL